MKTESDILLKILGDKLVSLNATFLGQTAADPYINISAFPLVYKAMRLYSDQQNKELREQWKQAVEFAATKGAENERLTKELSDLDAKYRTLVEEAGDERTEKAKTIQRLTKELEKAMEAPNIDEEAHNYAASKIWIDKRDVEIQTPPVHEFHEYIANKSFKAGAEYMMPQLTSLTKEVEELKRGMQKLPFDTVADYELCKKAYQSSSEHAEGFAIKLAKADAELTRLRELLGKCQVILEENPVKFLKLLRDLDTALNHKP